MWGEGGIAEESSLLLGEEDTRDIPAVTCLSPAVT